MEQELTTGIGQQDYSTEIENLMVENPEFDDQIWASN